MAAQRITSSGAIRITSTGAERITSTIEASTVGPITLPRDVRRSLADVRLVLGENGADLALEAGDLALEHGLRTAVVTSLFSDARAEDQDALPPEESSRRGFWADVAPDRYGSLLWLLQREKVTKSTLERARQYARNALQWMVQEGIAERVEVEATVLSTFTIGLTIRIHRGRARRWSALWDGTAKELEAAAEGVEVRILTA